MRPFDRSIGGGCQDIAIVVGLVASALIFRGGAPGTKEFDFGWFVFFLGFFFIVRGRVFCGEIQFMVKFYRYEPNTKNEKIW